MHEKLHVQYCAYHNKNLIIMKNIALSKLLCSPVKEKSVFTCHLASQHCTKSSELFLNINQHSCKNPFHCIFVVEILALICFSSLIALVLLLNFHYLYSLAKTVQRGTEFDSSLVGFAFKGTELLLKSVSQRCLALLKVRLLIQNWLNIN